MKLECLTQEEPVNKAVLNRKMMYFLRAVKEHSNELHRADHPSNEFRKAAEKTCNALDSILEDFRIVPEEGIMDALNATSERCVHEMEKHPYYYRQLSLYEGGEFRSILKLKYIEGKPVDHSFGMKMRASAERSVHNFARLIELFCKGTKANMNIGPALEKCIGIAKQHEAKDRPNEVVKFQPFPRLVKG